MKETIAEYARIILIIISFAAISYFIFGGVWFHRLGNASDSMQNEIRQEKQVAVLEKIETKEPPVLGVIGKTYTTGKTINLTDNIVTAYTIDEGDTIDLKAEVTIECDSEYFDSETKSITPKTQGVYIVTYSVKDDYGLKTTKNIKIVVENRLH